MSTNATWADKARDRIRRLAAETSQAAVTVGKIILEARARLSDKEWSEWRDSLPYGRRTFYRLLTVGVAFGHRDCANLAHIELSALYVLAPVSCPETARAAALKMAARGEIVTHETAQALIAGHQPKDKPAAPDNLPAYARVLLLDRLNIAIESETVKIVGNAGDDLPPAVTWAGLQELVAALFPGECLHARDLPAAAATDPPGSPGRVDTYASRFRKSLDLFHPADAKVLPNGRAVAGHQRQNGQGGPVVTGWAG